MAIEKDSRQLHEINVSFLVELEAGWDYTPQDRALDLYATLLTQGLVEGMRIWHINPLEFDTAVSKFDPKIWGEDVLCSSACDVNAGCECHGGYEDE